MFCLSVLEKTINVIVVKIRIDIFLTKSQDKSPLNNPIFLNQIAFLKLERKRRNSFEFSSTDFDRMWLVFSTIWIRTLSAFPILRIGQAIETYPSFTIIDMGKKKVVFENVRIARNFSGKVWRRHACKVLYSFKKKLLFFPQQWLF